MKINPTRLEDYIGEPKQFQDLREAIKNKQPVLVYGNAGTGKTSSIRLIAREFGLKVIEVNSSDQRKKEQLEFILSIADSKSYIPLLILIDECDGLDDSKVLERLASGSSHSITFTANELYKVPESIKKRCLKIEFKNPRITDVVTYLRGIEERQNRTFNYSSISQDVRNSLQSVMYGGEGYSSVNIFDEMNSFFSGKDKPLDRDKMIWLLDNADKFFNGAELYKFFKTLALSDKIHTPNLMNAVKRDGAGRVTYPYYFKKITSAKKGDNSGRTA